MTVKIDTTARIEKIRMQPQGAFPAGDPESGYGWLYFVTGSANGGMYFENDAGMRIGPFITGTSKSELDYVEFTSTVNITATTEATADTVVTGSAIVYDGVTPVVIEFFTSGARPKAAEGETLSIWLYDGSSSIGLLGFFGSASAAGDNKPMYLNRRMTPSAASHTYSIRASVSTATGIVGAGAGGTATSMPGYIRIVKANP